MQIGAKSWTRTLCRANPPKKTRAIGGCIPMLIECEGLGEGVRADAGEDDETAENLALAKKVDTFQTLKFAFCFACSLPTASKR